MRIQRTTAEWAVLIADHKKSGQTVQAFCRAKGIHPNVFYRKQKQLRSNEQTFVRVQTVSGACGVGTIRIGDIEIDAQENVSDDFLVRMIRCAIEARNAVVSG